MSARGPPRESIKEVKKSTLNHNVTAPHLPDADPELQHDVDILFPRQPRPSATTRSTLSSGKSRKSKNSDTTNRMPVDPANVVLSRGRPMKPHETEPFLSIDNLPPEKTFISEKTTLSGTPRNKARQVQAKSPAITQLQRMSVYMSPYSRETPGAPSPSVISGKLSPNKICKSPPPNSSKPRPTSGSRPNTATQEEKNEDQTGTADLGTEAVPAKISKSSTGSKLQTEQNMKENVSRPNTGTRIKFDSRPSSTSKLGSRLGAGSRFGRQGSGIRQKGMRSLPSRNGRITPANTPYQSPNKQLSTPNHHVKSPFKHNVSKQELASELRPICTPSMGLKERTALAAHHINKMVAVASEKDSHKVKGRLQKGKLKPLYPVSVEGPKIEKCRGIISETRSYGSSPSRTLQRRLHLINTIPNVHEYLYDRPRTVESVHRTSIASTIDDNFDYEEDNKLPDEIIYPPPKTGSMVEPRTPENTFVPIQDPEEHRVRQKSRFNNESHQVFATEINALTTDDVNISTQLKQTLVVSDGPQHGDNLNKNHSNNLNHELGADEGNWDETQLGPEQVRGISSSKSVRFADDRNSNTKEIKQITNNNIAMQLKNQGDLSIEENNEDDTVAKKNKQNSESCKSDDIKEFRKADNDSDDDGEQEDNKRSDAGNKADGDADKTNSRISDSANTDKTLDKEGDSKENGKAKDGELLCDIDDYDMDRTNTDKTKNAKKSTSIKKSPKPRSGVNSRPSSGRTSASSDRLHKSTKGESCLKFDKSPASKTHTQKLEVSSVIHGSSVHVGLRPESPSRSPSRSCSPSRHNRFHRKNRVPFLSEDNWFQDAIGDDLYNPSSSRSKVTFLLENEEPVIETIFVEDDDDIKLKHDTHISFDTLEAEIASLRTNIQNDMNNTVIQENEEINNTNHDDISDSETVVEIDEQSVAMETDRDETERGDYSDILEKYRQKCMDRSEKCGAISGLLATPRDGDSVISSSNISNKGNNSWHFDNTSLPKSQVLSNPVSSDSGHGSVENLSEFSRSASVSVSEIPRLDLGGSTSDLEIDTGRSEMTNLSNNNEEDDKMAGNLLEMVCNQLSPLDGKEKKEEKTKRKDELKRIMNSHRIKREEDVSKLTVVATTKSLSKSNKSKRTTSTNKAPYPPLCFTVNARPPAGYLYYFAYGPDMNPDRFKNYIMRGDVKRYWGLLFGFNLIFNKKGASEEAGGFSNIEFNPLRSVEGCLYKITPQELQVLDKCIGYPEHYQHLVLPVWMSNSSSPDSLGVAQYCVPALMYIAQNKWTETERTLDYEYSLSQCIKSADLVTTEYRESLVAMTTQIETTA